MEFWTKIVIVLHVLIALLVGMVALGHLTTAQVQGAQEYVLAIAAQPTLGHIGFIAIAIAALLSTASAINATLFGAARLAMVMANEHLLPRMFASREMKHAAAYQRVLNSSHAAG